MQLLVPLGLIFALVAPGAPPQGGRASRTTSSDQMADRMAENSVEVRSLRKAVRELTTQIRDLQKTMAQQQPSDTTRFNQDAVRLQLVLADLDRLRKSRDEARARLSDAQVRQVNIQTRLSNVAAEVGRSGQLISLDRQTAEESVRRALQIQFDQVTEEVRADQEDLDNLEEQIRVSELLAATLRRRLKIDASQIDVLEGEDQPNGADSGTPTASEPDSPEDQPPPEDVEPPT